MYIKRLRKMIENHPIEQADGSNSFEDKFNFICETTFKDLITFDFIQTKSELENRVTDFEE